MSNFERLNARIIDQLVRFNQAYNTGKEQLREIQEETKNFKADDIPVNSPERIWLKHRQDVALRLNFFINGFESAIAKFEQEMRIEIIEHTTWMQTKQIEIDPSFHIDQAIAQKKEYIERFEVVGSSENNQPGQRALSEHEEELAKLVNARLRYAQDFLATVLNATKHYVTVENLGHYTYTPAGDRLNNYLQCTELELFEIKEQITRYSEKASRNLEESTKFHLLTENELMLQEYLDLSKHFKAYALRDRNNDQIAKFEVTK